MIDVNCVKDIISEGDKICVAVSGGMDSVSLLHFLSVHKNELKIELSAVNVEHGIRGDASKSDTEFVKKFCQKLNVECKCFSVDAVKYKEDNNLTLEQSARMLRYKIFDELIENEGVKIATAHNADDNAETVLMRILRGTGLKGLCGIARRRGSYIRPLIYTSRKEIEEYVKENCLSYVTDETNFDTDYTRNFLRHEIFNKLNERFNTGAAFSKLSRAAVENEDYFEDIVSECVTFDNGAYLVPTELLAEPVLFKRAVYGAFNALGVCVDVEERHVNLLIDLALNGDNGDVLDMPYGVKAEYENFSIALFMPYAKCMDEVPVDIGVTRIGRYVSTIKSETERIDGKLCFDMDKVNTAVIRTRRDGDVFTKFGGGTKSLNDYFTDKKIPLRLRDGIPLIVSGNKVLAIGGVEISNSVKIDKDTKRIVSFAINYN